MVTGLYAGILGLMLVVLLVRVVRLRMKNRVGLGDGDFPDLRQAIRVHGNFTETVPFALLILFLMEMSELPDLLLHGYGVLLVVLRLLHAQGLTQSATTSFGRFYGTLGTSILIATGSLICIGAYFFS